MRPISPALEDARPAPTVIEQAPVRIAQIDIDDPFTDIDCHRSDGAAYRAAWILVRRGGTPIGDLTLAVTEGRVSAEALSEAVASSRWGQPAPPPEPLEASLPSVSVIVPTAMTRPEQLEPALASIAALDYPDFEVIAVDNHQGDRAQLDLPGVRVVRAPRPGLSAARNAGLAAATGEIIAFTDDDVEVDRGWLRGLVARFLEDPAVAVVSGLVVPYELESDAQIGFELFYGLMPGRSYRPWRFERTGLFKIRRTDLADGTQQVYSLYKTDELGIGANMAFRASEIRDVGGFDVGLGAGTATHSGEETAVFVEFLMRNRAIVLEPTAIVWHKHRATQDALERQTHGYGVGFTATLVALALRNPLHVLGLASILAPGLRSMRTPARRSPTPIGSEYSAQLWRLKRRAMWKGPAAYAKACWTQRRWNADAENPATDVNT